MLIDLHAHHITPGMLNFDPKWGPSFEGGTLKIGEFYVGSKKIPRLAEVADKKDVGSGDLIVQRMDHEFRHHVMEKLGIDKIVVSLASPMYMYGAGDVGVGFASVVNDEFAAWCAAEPKTFFWWAHLPLQQPAEAAKELERAVGMGAVGFMCAGGDFDGLYLHSPEMDVVWAKATELDVPVMIHGQNLAQVAGEKDILTTAATMGFCYDEARAFWHLTAGGVLDRFPALKVYITHAGGFVPFQYERFNEVNKTLAPDAVNEKPIIDYLPSFYFDPMIPSPIIRKMIVDIIGVDRLLYGTNLMGADQIENELTEGIGLSDDEREKIRSGNAVKLLKLEDRI